jgi:5-methylcytosine-specific restriction endonuclease McrA
MAKRIPRPCTPENCGDLYEKCGRLNTYTRKKCRCDSCAEAKRDSQQRWYSDNPNYNSRYYEATRDEQLELQRIRYAIDPEPKRAQVRSYYKKNAGKISERGRVYREKNASQISEKKRRDYRENHDTILAKYRERYAENAEVILKRNSTWRRSNQDVIRSHHATRRARKREAFVEHVDRAQVFDRDGYICQRCGIQCDPVAVYPARNFATLDHIVALANGGEHSYANSQTLCGPCNSAKGARE